MTFPSSDGNIQAIQEYLIRKVSLAVNELFVSAPDGSIVGTGVLIGDVEKIANKDVANGYAGLDGAGKLNLSVIPASLLGALKYQGTWNATTNTPALASGVGSQGDYYVVSVAGTTNLDGVNDWAAGDWAVFNGTAWQKVDNTDGVVSVNGQQGVVVLNKNDIGLGNVPNVDATNASNITSGSLSDARLSANVALLTAVQTLTNKTLGAGSKVNLGAVALGDLYYGDATGALIRIPAGTAGQVLTMVAGVPTWQTPTAGSGNMLLFASMTAEANNTTGLFSKASENVYNNPSGRPLTTPFDPGFSNGGNSPFLIPVAKTLNKVHVHFAGAATGNGAVAAPLVLRLRLYQLNYSSRTQLGADIDITINTAGVGTFNNASGNAFQFASSGALAIAIPAGAMIGIEFVNVSGSSNNINALRVCELTLELS